MIYNEANRRFVRNIVGLSQANNREGKVQLTGYYSHRDYCLHQGNDLQCR